MSLRSSERRTRALRNSDDCRYLIIYYYIFHYGKEVRVERVLDRGICLTL